MIVKTRAGGTLTMAEDLTATRKRGRRTAGSLFARVQAV